MSDDKATERNYLALLAILAFVPFLPALFSGEILVFRDHFDYFLPLRQYTAEVLRSGEIPFWNPYNGSGERWLANPQTGVFYPPAWLFVFFPLPIAAALFPAFHLIVLGWGTYFLLRRWCSMRAASLAAVALMMSGPVLSIVDVANNLSTFVWLPWLLLSTLRLRPDSRMLPVLPACFLALSFLGGEPLFAAIHALLFVLIAAARLGRRASLVIPATALLTVLLTAPQLFPFLEMLPGSDRSHGLPIEQALHESASPVDWVTIAHPAPAPRFIDAPRLSQGFIRSMYLNTLIAAAAFLTLLAFVRRERHPSILWLSLLLVVVIVMSAGPFLPLVPELYALLRLDTSRYPARLIPYGAFALAALAAHGFDLLSTVSRNRRLATAIAVGLAMAVALVRYDPGAVVWYAFAAVNLLVALLVLIAFPRFLHNERLQLLALVWIAADLVIASAFLFASAPVGELRSPWADQLDRNQKIARYSQRPPEPGTEGKRLLMAGYLNLIERQFDFSTPAPVVPRRYLEFHDTVLHTPRFELMDEVSLGSLIIDRPVPREQFHAVGERGGYRLYRNLWSQPMVRLATGTRNVDPETAYEEWINAANPSRTFLVSGPAPEPDERVEEALVGRVRRVWIAPNAVEIDVSLSLPAIVVINQLHTDGWRVTNNGTAVSAVLVNGLFRGVSLPAGDHQIVWSYRPPFFLAATLMFVAGAVWIMVTALLHRNRRRTPVDDSALHSA